VDGLVIKALSTGSYEPFVLVTWDNKMVAVHKNELARHNTTLAIIDRAAFVRGPYHESQEENYYRDVVHRWLHRIEIMRAGEIRFFSPKGSRPA
jgi:hypothetical protein